jgi:hypothetical protein
MDQLHKHEFISLLANALLDVVQACFHSCAGPTTWVWLLAHPNTSSFYLSFTHFLTTFYIFFGIPHPTIVHLSQC